MKSIADATGGTLSCTQGDQLPTLPAIYIKETRIVSQSFLHEQAIPARTCVIPRRPAAGLAGPLPPLYGFVRTRQETVPLVDNADRGAQGWRPGISRSWPTGIMVSARPSPSPATPARSRRPPGLGPRLGRLGHLSEVLGASHRLELARSVETGKLAMMHRISRRQNQGHRRCPRREQKADDQSATRRRGHAAIAARPTAENRSHWSSNKKTPVNTKRSSRRTRPVPISSTPPRSRPRRKNKTEKKCRSKEPWTASVPA